MPWCGFGPWPCSATVERSIVCDPVGVEVGWCSGERLAAGTRPESRPVLGAGVDRTSASGASESGSGVVGHPTLVKRRA